MLFRSISCVVKLGGVAQLVSALDLHSKGSEFKSQLLYHILEDDYEHLLLYFKAKTMFTVGIRTSSFI